MISRETWDPYHFMENEIYIPVLHRHFENIIPDSREMAHTF